MLQFTNQVLWGTFFMSMSNLQKNDRYPTKTGGYDAIVF